MSSIDRDAVADLLALLWRHDAETRHRDALEQRAIFAGRNAARTSIIDPDPRRGPCPVRPHPDGCRECAGVDAAWATLDAILPAVEQEIREAEQRGREQAAAAIEAARRRPDEGTYGEFSTWVFYNGMTEAAALARGGSTDEEQA